MQTEDTLNCGGKRLKGLFKEGTSERPLISVITVVFNNVRSVEATIQSVLRQTYENVEYIVIDGGSSDGTLDIIRKYDNALDYWLSEPDKGIYDAMNKGITASTGTWLSMLNSGDIYANSLTLATIAGSCFHSGASFIYSDVLLAKRQPFQGMVLSRCDHKRLILNHQTSIYQKSLHAECGVYLVARGVTISDYLFFSLVPQDKFLKVDHPIAIYDTTGVSQMRGHTDQKFIVDYLVNRMPRSKFLVYFNLYYPYRRTKDALIRFWRRLGSED